MGAWWMDVQGNMKRQPITRSMDLHATIDLMAEGNKNSKKVLLLCAQTDPMILLNLDDMNCRGDQIWAAFYFWADGLFEKFALAVKSRDLGMLNYLNKTLPLGHAVPHGGAPR
jgi:hypothetical protein